MDSLVDLLIENLRLILVLVLFLYGLTSFLFTLRKLKEKKLHFEQSLVVDQKPYPFRGLNPDEKNQLQQFVKSSYKLSFNYIFIFIFSFFLLVGEFRSDAQDKISKSLLLLCLIVIAAILGTFLFYLGSRRQGKLFKMDLEEPVFKVYGRVHKHERSRRRFKKELLYVTVSGVTFDGNFTLPSGANLYDEVIEGQGITIEYSPHTKYIWNIRK